MSSKLKTTVASLALIAVCGTGLATAQTAPEADPSAQGESQPAESQNSESQAAPEAGQGEQPAQIELPELLQGDGFTDITTHPGPRGSSFVKGTIAETGKDFDAIIGSDGELVGMRTAEGSSLPQALVDELLPQAARDNAVTAEITELNAIGTRGDAVMISGQDESGDMIRIGFGEEGELMHFSRGDEMRDGKGPRGDMRRPMDPRGDKKMHRDGDGKGHMGDQPRGDREGGDRPRGDREGGDRDGGDRPARRESGGDPARMTPPAPQGDQPPAGDQPARGDAPAAPVDEAALRAAVEAAGYTDLGTTRPAGPGVTIEAVNPEGEDVIVTVTPAGEVVRETGR